MICQWRADKLLAEAEPCPISIIYYSFKIFLRFWSAKIPHMIIVTIRLTIFGRILRYVKNDVNCVANYQIIEQLTEKTWGLR